MCQVLRIQLPLHSLAQQQIFPSNTLSSSPFEEPTLRVYLYDLATKQRDEVLEQQPSELAPRLSLLDRFFRQSHSFVTSCELTQDRQYSKVVDFHFSVVAMRIFGRTMRVSHTGSHTALASFGQPAMVIFEEESALHPRIAP